MQIFHYFVLILSVFGFTANAGLASGDSSRIDLDGIADFIPYEGAQPELVKGTHKHTVQGAPVLRHAYLVAPDILALTVDEFGFKRHGIVPYEPQPEDKVTFHLKGLEKRLWDASGITPFTFEGDKDKETIGHARFVYRDGEPLGHLVGKEGEQLWPVEPVLGEAWNWEQAQDIRSYKLYLSGSSGEEAMIPEVVYRKTKPHGKSNVGPGYSSHSCYQHQIYLKFSQDLPMNEKVRLDFQNLGLKQESTTILLDDSRLRTEAIQVSQAGYHPQQSVKRAFLSTWMGPGGSLNYEEVSTFHIVSEKNGNTVFTGKPKRIAVPHKPDYTTPRTGPVNFSKTYVYALDFSSLSEEGNYRVHVPDLGVSFSFPVTQDIWDEAARLQMLGYYHQRSGMSLGPPASEWERPRNFHPEEFPIHDVDRSVYFDKERYTRGEWNAGNPFDRLQKSMLLESNLSEAYGGWADAADYDRREPHWRAVMAMLFLHEIRPGFFENWELSLPEAEQSNDIPDILDEALWSTEVYRRTQLKDGEVIEGIESVAHPRRGESSWRNSLPTAIKPGTPAVAYHWAGVAARMSMALESYDKKLAKKYKTSAMEAIEWVQEHLGDERFKDFRPSSGDRMTAGIYLYQLTGEEQWHDIFKKGWKRGFGSGAESMNRYDPYAVLSYALMPVEKANPEIHRKARKGILNYADKILKGTEENPNWLLRPEGERVNFAIVEQLGSEYLMGAHLLSGKDKYVEGLLKCSHFAMGANPLNLCYTTGMGQRFIQPFYLDYEYTDLPIPSGIPAYGPVRRQKPLPESSWGWDKPQAEGFASELQPSDIHRWPLNELYFRYVGFPAMNEFTVQQGMREQLTRWAYLAQYFHKQ